MSTDTSSCSEKCDDRWRSLLPPFVTEGKKLSSLTVRRNLYDKTVEFRVGFVGRTEQAIRAWERLKVPLLLPSAGDEPPCFVTCDGPCGRAIGDSENVTQFGLCDHNICPVCVGNSRRDLYEGTPCCCSPDCQGKTASCRSSRTNLPLPPPAAVASVPAERSAVLLQICLRCFEPVGGRLSQKKLDYEVCSNTPMADVLLKAVQLFERPEADYDWFYVAKMKYTKKDLVPFETDAVRNRTLDLFYLPEEVMTIVAVKKGLHLF